MKRKDSKIKKPTVVGAVIDLGYCLDLTTSRGLQQVRSAHDKLKSVFDAANRPLPQNQADGLRHNLDCAVINYLHTLDTEDSNPPFDSVKGIFIEAPDLYPGSGFGSKNHIQIAVRNLDCIKGVFRVPKAHLAG